MKKEQEELKLASIEPKRYDFKEEYLDFLKYLADKAEKYMLEKFKFYGEKK